MRGHLYCSSRCARNAGRDDLKMRVRESLGRPLSARLADGWNEWGGTAETFRARTASLRAAVRAGGPLA